ncbi:MAG: hypothetical protein NWE96_07510 [Candidatus Bathyarchaeota archaeon]|nr:hypothetical protein [Candidatus Bathyarchaeota archaeon]
MKKSLSLLFCLTLLLTSSFVIVAHAATVTVSVQTNSAYNRLELATITGQLTSDGTPVIDGLVAVQITAPNSNILSMRTLNTGNNPSSQVATIQSVYLSDQEGNQIATVAKGNLAYFKVTIINNDLQARNIMVALTIYDNYNTPVGFASSSTLMQAKETGQIILSIPIQSYVATGMARVFAAAYSNKINMGGVPYSIESSSTFGIGTQQGTAPPSTQTGIQGNYTLQMKIPINAPTGTYTLHSGASVAGFFASASTEFNVNQAGDLNSDGKIDITDITQFVIAYINYWNSAPYNNLADLDHNGIINANDITLFCYAYIQYWSWQ